MLQLFYPYKAKVPKTNVTCDTGNELGPDGAWILHRYGFVSFLALSENQV